MIGRIAALFASGRAPKARCSVIEVRHSGECYGVEVRRSASARRLILRVRGATRDAVLTIPKRTSLADARSFAERQAAWIGARLRRLPDTIPLEAGSVIPLRGVMTLIVSRPLERGTVWIEAGPHPDAAQYLCVAGDRRHLSRRLLDFSGGNAAGILIDPLPKLWCASVARCRKSPFATRPPVGVRAPQGVLSIFHGASYSRPNSCLPIWRHMRSAISFTWIIRRNSGLYVTH